MHSNPLEDGEIDEVELSPSDRQMIRAMATAQSAQSAVGALRGFAVVAAIVVVVGQALSALDYVSPQNRDSLFADPEPDRNQWAVFLTGISIPLVLVGLLVVASYVLAVYAARLDMDIVIAEQNEQDEADEPTSA
ncbi:MAG: hypothetical protein Q7V88_12810 [Actinomycetota bacterium]|nr:hypothetical protein [Actinomycetota bacterium]